MRVCAGIKYVTMRRSYTIGFDAKHANRGNTTQSNYARFVISALSEAVPKSAYFRAYIERSEPHDEYEELAHRANVESMEPDGSFWRRFSSLWRLWHVGRDMQRGDVELYHALAGVVPCGLARRNIRSVVTVHNLEFLRLRHYFTPLSNLYRRVMMYTSMCRADRIIAVSEHLKQELVHHFRIDPDKIDVIYGGCHRRFSEPISDERVEAVKERYNLPEKYLLVLGAHRAHKNLNLILEALPKIDPQLKIVIVGRSTKYTDTLMRRIRSLGVEERVQMVQGVEREDMPAIYRAATAYLMLSLYDGFATTIVEALTVGTPVIAARGSSLEETGGEGSIYIDPKSSSALVGAVNSIMQSEELRERMIEQGKEYAKRFRPEVIAYNILNCYRRIGVDIPL